MTFPRGLKHGLKKKKKHTKSYHIAENLENRKKKKKPPYYLNSGALTSSLSAYFFVQNFKNVSISLLPLHLSTVA